MTERQAQVVQLVGQGLPNKAVATRLNLSVRTVEWYVAEIAARLPNPHKLMPRALIIVSRAGSSGPVVLQDSRPAA